MQNPEKEETDLRTGTPNASDAEGTDIWLAIVKTPEKNKELSTGEIDAPESPEVKAELVATIVKSTVTLLAIANPVHLVLFRKTRGLLCVW